MASNDVALRSVGSAQGAEAPAAPRPAYWREVFAELRRDRLIYAVMGAYALAAWG